MRRQLAVSREFVSTVSRGGVVSAFDGNDDRFGENPPMARAFARVCEASLCIGNQRHDAPLLQEDARYVRRMRSFVQSEHDFGDNEVGALRGVGVVRGRALKVV